MIMEYIIYYTLSNKQYRIYNAKTKDYSTMDTLPKNVSAFYLSGKKYNANDDELLRYATDLLKSSEELKQYKAFKGYKQRFDYIQPFRMRDGKYFYRTHDGNIERFLKLFISRDLLETLEPIEKEEINYERKTYRAGLIYSVKGQYDSFGYDMSNFYASILASKQFKLPIRKGREIKLDTIPDIDSIQYGYYKVYIECTHSDIKKLFAFSKEKVYTHYDLKYALRLQEWYDIKITLDTDEKNNAYIYEEKDLIRGYEIFNDWYQAILELKKEYPKNILTKMLSSSLWGHLTRKNILYKTEEDGDKLNIGTTDDVDYLIQEFNYNSDGSAYYKLLNLNNPYKHPFRIKAFLTAYARNKMANIALMDIDSVIRIHTDGICFNKEQSFNIPNFIPEAKTTGLIQFPIYRISNKS